MQTYTCYKYCEVVCRKRYRCLVLVIKKPKVDVDAHPAIGVAVPSPRPLHPTTPPPFARSYSHNTTEVSIRNKNSKLQTGYDRNKYVFKQIYIYRYSFQYIGLSWEKRIWGWRCVRPYQINDTSRSQSEVQYTESSEQINTCSMRPSLRSNRGRSGAVFGDQLL